MAVAFESVVPGQREVVLLLQSIDELLATYLRRSITGGEKAVPLSVLIKDLGGLVEAARANASGNGHALAPSAPRDGAGTA